MCSCPTRPPERGTLLAPSLRAVLAEGERRGLVGGDLDDHLRHAEAFGGALDRAGGFDGTLLDLGSGGGLPGLVLAAQRPASHWYLLDSRQRATQFLDWAVSELQLEERVQVVADRAEHAGRNATHRGAHQAVVARAFGRPAVVAECAAPLLRLGGVLVVSERPSGESRWPEDGLAELGLRLEREDRRPAGEGSDRAFVVLRQVTACPRRYPRRPGQPAKRPLF